MTRRQIARRAADPEHKKLMLAYRSAPNGERSAAWKRLRDYVAAKLRDEAKA